MNRTRAKTSRVAALAGLILAVGLAAPLAAATGGVSAPARWAVTPVASGLDSPRGLAFAPDGSLLVAEAGHGGDVCVADPQAPTGRHCIGLTSQISKVDPASGAHSVVVPGLFSSAALGVTGVDGIAAQTGRKPGSTTGKLFGIITEYPQELDGWTCAGQPADCTTVLAAARSQAGQLIEFATTGSWSAVSSVGSFDYDWTRANHALSSEWDANPYGVLPLLRGTWVADAGSNTLNWIPSSGGDVIASGIPLPGPGFPTDGVPTCLAMRGGNLYAADLAGRFWRRNGSFDPTAVPVADGTGKSLIHHVTGCTVDAKGNFYLVDMWGAPGPPIPAGPQSVATTGSVVELAKNGTASVLATGLTFPNGIAVGRDGSIYVSVGSTCAAAGDPFPYCAKGGQIVRLSSS